MRQGSERIPSMDVRIKTTVAFTIAGSSLEDALAEYEIPTFVVRPGQDLAEALAR